MKLHVSNVSPDLVALVVPAPPPKPPWWSEMTNDQIVSSIRQMLREMTYVPFNPETARIELPAFLHGRRP